MSSNSVQLASALLGELFCEPVVPSVGRCLLNKNRALTVKQLAMETGLAINKVSMALCVLIQHGMVTFAQHKNGHVEYAVNLEQVLCIGRYPHYIWLASKRYGEAAELLVSKLILHGSLTVSAVVHVVTDKLNKSIASGSGDEIKAGIVFDKFVALAGDKLVQRWPPLISPPSSDECVVPEFQVISDAANLYEIPKVNLKMIEMRLKGESDDGGAPAAKRSRIDDAPQMPDDGIYWRVNFDRFDQVMRDRIMVSAMTRALDDQAAAVVSSILQMAETQSVEWASSTNPTSFYDIKRQLSGSGESTEMLSQYMTLLTDDKNGFVTKELESGGGMFSVNYKQAIYSLTVATIENIVQERFGSKCLRLFRLIRQKKYLEQKQIEEMAMFPAKDAKEMTYLMLSKGFVHVKEVSRTPDHAPSRTFYLFHVDLTMVVRSVLEWCHKFAVNLMVRREHENAANKRLSEKEQRVEVILQSLRLQSGGGDAQLEEVMEFITPAERAQLAKLKHVCRKLELGELQLDETTFVLRLYLRYHR